MFGCMAMALNEKGLDRRAIGRTGVGHSFTKRYTIMTGDSALR